MGEARRRRQLGTGGPPDLGFCPATMCPLFARDGSPWTGDVNAPCSGKACQWFRSGRCTGHDVARAQVGEAAAGRMPLQVGPRQATRAAVPAGAYACPRAAECRWQREAGDRLCPPRDALARGLDPRVVAY